MTVYTLPKILHPSFTSPRQKPTGDFEIDYSHPLAQGIVFCEVFNAGARDLVTGITPTDANKPTFRYGAHGSEQDYDNDNDERLSYGSFSQIQGATKLSFLSLCKFDDDLTDHGIISKAKGTNPADWFEEGFILHMDASGPAFTDTLELFVAEGSGDNARVGAGSNSSNVGQYQTVAATFEGGVDLRIYLDGVESGNSPQSAASVLTSGANLADLTVGAGGPANNNPNDGQIVYVYMWAGRVLTIDEIQSLTDDPYQIFKPKLPFSYNTAAAPVIAPEIVTPLPMRAYRHKGRYV